MISNQCYQHSKQFQKPQMTEKQQKQADKSLAYLQGVEKFAHNVLYCRDPHEILTKAESSILVKERKKYLDHICKNYKYKIPQQFVSKKLMKEKTLVLKKKEKQQRLKTLQKIKSMKRPRMRQAEKEDPKPRKLIKTQESTKNKQKSVKKVQDEKKPNKRKDGKAKKDEKVKNEEQEQEDKIVLAKEEEEMEGMVEEGFESQQNLVNKDLSEYEDDQ